MPNQEENSRGSSGSRQQPAAATRSSQQPSLAAAAIGKGRRQQPPAAVAAGPPLQDFTCPSCNEVIPHNNNAGFQASTSNYMWTRTGNSQRQPSRAITANTPTRMQKSGRVSTPGMQRSSRSTASSQRSSLDKHICCNNIDRDCNVTKLRVRNMFKALRNDLRIEMAHNAGLLTTCSPRWWP